MPKNKNRGKEKKKPKKPKVKGVVKTPTQQDKMTTWQDKARERTGEKLG